MRLRCLTYRQINCEPNMSQPDTSSVTAWLPALKAGDNDAAQQLWEAYYQRLIYFARARLRDVPKRDFDEDDVVLSAFNSFYHRAGRSAFPQLNDRQDLWALLVTITARKILQKQRSQMAQRRGGGRQPVASAADHPEKHLQALNEIIGREPTPEFAAELAERVDELLRELGQADLQQIAIAKMEGYATHEIAQQIGLTERTVRRKLKVIATLWENA